MLLLDYRSDLILLSYCSCRKYVKRDLIIWSEGKIWNSVCCNKGVEPREGGIAFVFLLLFTRSMEPNMRIDSHCSYACRVYRPNISSFFVLRHDIFFNTCPLPLPPRPSCTRPFKWLPFDYLSKAAHVASGARVWYENNSIFSFVMRGAGFCYFFFFFLVSGVASNLPMFYASFFQNVTSRHLNLTLASMDRPTFTVD